MMFELAVDRVALQSIAGKRNEVVLGVELESSGAREEPLTGSFDDEEAVALDREIGVQSGRADRAVAEVALRAGHRDTEADLAGVGAAGRRVRRGAEAEGAIEGR